MLIRVDQSLPEPLYAQIRASVIAGIATGQLQPGDPLPSVRALASDLGVNLHTVNKAYAVLRDEGYVLMQGRAGALVAQPLNAADPHQAASAQAKFAEALYRIAIESKAAGISAEQFGAMVQEQLKRAYAISSEHARESEDRK